MPDSVAHLGNQATVEPCKTCRSCHSLLPLRSFSVTVQGTYAQRCDPCRTTAIPHLNSGGDMVKRCAGCGLILPLDNFSRIGKGHGYSYRCRTCIARKWAEKPGRGRTGRKPYVEPVGKQCRRCGIWKEIEDFRPRYERANGRTSKCRQCERELHSDWRRRHVGASRSRNLKSKYGIGGDEYKMILEAQGGRCGICGQSTSGNALSPFLYVDHAHGNEHESPKGASPGAIRGLLCHPCNQIIGYLDSRVLSAHQLVSWIAEGGTLGRDAALRDRVCGRESLVDGGCATR